MLQRIRTLQSLTAFNHDVSIGMPSYLKPRYEWVEGAS